MRRAFAIVVITCVLSSAAPAHARTYWEKRLDRVVAGKRIGVAVYDEGRWIYRRSAGTNRIPASNEKLLLSMALFETLGAEARLETRAMIAGLPVTGTLKGNVWISGRGDPSITAGGRFGKSLPFAPTKLGALARGIAKSGIRRIHGRVIGDMGYFRRDWFAPGWKSSFPARYIPLPTALTFEGNTHAGRHIRDPEERAARALTRKLKRLGVSVRRSPGSGHMPSGLTPVATATSENLSTIVRYMNRSSSNFFAEVLGKRLGVERSGAPGTIAKGAAAIRAFAARRGVDVTTHDSSGLSYRNRAAPAGIVKLLTHVEHETPYYVPLRNGLPKGGQGTLEKRLRGVRVRAKTGSLNGISALSGWVWLDRTGTWAEFSILSSGMSYYTAKGVEDHIVKLLAAHAR